MVTIDDIAREAGVSCTTVSNVIHGRTNRVSPETVRRIQELIQRRGYVPNLSARALKSRSTRVVALINPLGPSSEGRFQADPFFNILTGAVEETLRQRGYFLMIRAISEEEELMNFLLNWNVEGVFLPGLFEDDPLCQTLRKLKMPVVLTDSYISDLHGMTNIGIQDLEGARMATQHLIDNGHRRIVFAGAPLRKGGVVEQRLLGYRMALENSGIPYDPSLVYETEFGTSRMLELGKILAERRDFTALFASADLLAAGLMAGMQQNGRFVPRDVSVVGFDDINWCRMTSPTLTTIHQDADEKGRIAARHMLELLEGKRPEKSEIVLPVRLVRRESVAKI